jgi:pyruvate/2-oxoglutarate/acetoin dehydrogenase E1 component
VRIDLSIRKAQCAIKRRAPFFSRAPFDEETVLNLVAKTGRAVDEAVPIFGVRAEESAHVHEEIFGQLRSPVAHVGSQYDPVSSSPILERTFLCKADTLKKSIRETLGYVKP